MKTLLVLALGIIAIVVILLGALILHQKDIPDLLKARKIPKYPNATSWTIRSGCGVPGEGRCSADIKFQTTDSKDKVVAFYKSELPKLGIQYSTNVAVTGQKSPDTEEFGWMDFKGGATTYYFDYNKHGDTLEGWFNITKY